MVNPPRENAGYSKETLDSHLKECHDLFTGL